MKKDTNSNSPRPARGFICPRCGHRRFRTTNTQPLHDYRIRRRKTCRACGHKIVTYEVANASVQHKPC